MVIASQEGAALWYTHRSEYPYVLCTGHVGAVIATGAWQFHFVYTYSSKVVGNVFALAVTFEFCKAWSKELF